MPSGGVEVLLELSFRSRQDPVTVITQYNEIENAKLTYVKSQKVWKVYWMRQDVKWHSYEPNPVATSIESAVDIVMNDQHGCFWG
mgnify:CR=1 FL=1